MRYGSVLRALCVRDCIEIWFKLCQVRWNGKNVVY